MAAADSSTVISLFKAALPHERILGAETAQAIYGPSTVGKTSSKIYGTLKPASQEEVANIVSIASQHKVALYPISVGNNWGFGSKNPSADNCVIVDLSLMNRILEFDQSIGTITVEPGVTVAAVAEYLEKRAAPFIAPVIGAGARSSMIGNVLDKGISASLYTDRVSSLLSLTAILPDGSLYQSRSTGPATYRWGVGPYLDGLFLQNGIGIVTNATFLLAPKPAHTAVLFVPVATSEQTELLINHLGALMLKLSGVFASFQIEGPLRSFAHFTHRSKKSLSSEGITLRPVIAERLKKLGLGNWNGLVLLSGEPAVVNAAVAVARKELRRRGFVAKAYRKKGLRSTLKYLSFLPKKFRSSFTYLRLVEMFMERANGLSKPYDSRWLPLWWNSENVVGGEQSLVDSNVADLDADSKAGFIIFAAAYDATLPYARWVAEVEHICMTHGIEPMYSSVGLNERYIHFAVQISFDRRDEAAVAQAHVCYEHLFQSALVHGGLPYRVPIPMQHLLSSINADRWALAEKLNAALDPSNIIAPGRYRPPQT